jgi:hypothetical protein
VSQESRRGRLNGRSARCRAEAEKIGENVAVCLDEPCALKIATPTIDGSSLWPDPVPKYVLYQEALLSPESAQLPPVPAGTPYIGEFERVGAVPNDAQVAATCRSPDARRVTH